MNPQNFDKAKLEAILETEIGDINIYITAFTHRSYLNEHSEYKNPSNERLEFLGDAVLQLASSEFLYNTFPDSAEGDLTNYRASIVCTPSLAAEAKRLSYGDFLFLSYFFN
jgi:ribonuclease-3